MKKIISIVVTITLFLSTLNLGIPQLNGKASAAATVTQNHTFETTDLNFGSVEDGATISTFPTMVGVQGGFTARIVKDAGNRSMEVTVPANNAGRTTFYYLPGYAAQTIGNAFTFEGTITVSNQLRAFDLNVQPGDWKANLPLAQFLPNGDIQVRTGTVDTASYVKRGTWKANTKYIIKAVMYKDINKYDLFITEAGKTTMLASGAPLMNYAPDSSTPTVVQSLLTTGILAVNLEAKAATASTSVVFDDIKLSASDEVRDVYVPATDVTVLRTTTFETDDSDPTIAGTATGLDVVANILDGKSPSKMKIVNESNSRWLKVTTAQDEPGDLGFPMYASWGADSKFKSYTLEADYMLKDQNADYYLKLIDGSWGIQSNMVLLSKNGQIYARSSSDGPGAMAARTTWAVNQPFSLKLVVHTDTLSYDLFHVRNGISTKLVTNEPMQNAAAITANGLAAFMLYIGAGTHSESTVLVDNIKLSASNLPGTAPITNASPGASLDGGPAIGTPVNYYVSPTGNDANDGKSAATPFQSIQKAANLTAPGDTVYLMDGTYTYSGGNRMLIINKSGAYDTVNNRPAYITYKAYPGAKPILTTDNAWDVIQIVASYIVIDGLTIKGNNDNLNVTDGEEAYTYYMNATNAGTPIDYSNPVFTKTNTNGISVEGRNRVQSGLSPLTNIVIKNNEVYNLPGGGISAMESDYITIENNKVYNNAWYMIWAGSGISLLNSLDSDTNTTYKNIVRNNIVHHNETKVKWIATKGYSDGNGIIIDSNKNAGQSYPAYKGKTLVANNISYNNGGSGIHSFESAYVDIINNTLYNNNQSPHLTYAQLFASSSENVNLFNNIVYSRDLRPGERNYQMTNDSGSENVIYANNIYYNGGTPGVMGPNDRIVNPGFVSLDPASTDFLHLKSDSPAVDQGTQTLAPSVDFVNATRPKGAKYDIGAYESSFTSTNPIVDDVIDITAINNAKVFIPEIGKASKGTPVIDGTIDDVWNTTPVLNVSKYLNNSTGPVTSGATAKVRLLWDEDNLYVLAEVTDPVLSKANPNAWEQDSVELFIDENNAKTTSHQPDDRQYRINYDNEKSVGSQGDVSEFVSKTSKTLSGYIVETKIPFKTMKGLDGKVIGFDAQVNDDNGVGARTSTAVWSDIKGAGYSNTSRWGNVTLLNQALPAAPTITSVNPVNITTAVGTAPILPAAVTATWSDDTTSSVNVVWDAINPAKYAQVGSFTVNGTVAGTAIKAVATVTVAAGQQTPYVISFGAEQNGGAGKTRTITVTGGNSTPLAGKYFVVQTTEGTGASAKVSVIMISATSEAATVSYARAGTKVEVWLTSGMPDLVGENTGVTVSAYASTSP